ncbi:MAG: penicillin-binding protein 2 [Fimbriimonas sp.]
MSIIYTPPKPKVDARLLAFPVLITALLSAVFFRLWYFQVVKSEDLSVLAEESRELEVDQLAPRGIIVDRNGVLLAGIRPDLVVTAIPDLIKKHPQSLTDAARILSVEPTKLERKTRDASWRPFLPSPIYVGATIQQGTYFAESLDTMPGIGVDSQPMRYYPDTTSFSHVVGYVWTPNDRDVKRLTEDEIKPAEYVGKIGIERAYERDLMGDPGKQRLEVDARRRPIRIVGKDAPMPGSRLRLTLDARLQKIATGALAAVGKPGGIVAIDPRNGEVLCLASAPSFDQNLFRGGISDSEWEQLSSHPDKPMLNRAIYSSYAPGSIFKLVTTVAAMRAGKFDEHNVVVCRGGYKLGRMFKCLGHHGPISFHQALKVSCNTYFYTIGRAAGEDALRQAALDMGLGAQTGIEIGGEGKGVIPTLEWLKAVSGKEDPPWYGGDTLNMSIGQGYVATTPLQMANMIAFVANNGVSYRPHLVSQVEDPLTGEVTRRIEPEEIHRIDGPPGFWPIVKGALVDVIASGTAQRAKIPSVDWGGKTGSAEHSTKNTRKTHSWFVGYAPAENPTIAICVFVEDAGHGGEIAAPIAKQIVEEFLKPRPPLAPR